MFCVPKVLALSSILGAIALLSHPASGHPPASQPAQSAGLQSISSLPVTIDSSGVYVLTQSLSHAGSGMAIYVNAADVTIDLNGFTLSAGGAGMAIGMGLVAEKRKLTIKNGTIARFGRAFDLYATSVVLEKLQIVDCMQAGASYGRTAMSDCRVERAMEPLYLRGGCVVRHCVFQENGYPDEAAGFQPVLYLDGDGSLVEGNLFEGNASALAIRGGSIVRKNAFHGNRFFGILIYGTQDGGNMIEQNSFSKHRVGIKAENNGKGRIVGNHFSENRVGIEIGAFSTKNWIDGNSFIANLAGLGVLSAGNRVTRNSASGNVTSYSIAPGNDVAPIGTASLATSPWANLQD